MKGKIRILKTENGRIVQNGSKTTLVLAPGHPGCPLLVYLFTLITFQVTL